MCLFLVLPLPCLTAESSAKTNLSNLNQNSSSTPLSAGASTAVAKDSANIDKLRANGTTRAAAVTGIMTCIVSGGQNNVVVPGGQNNVVLPGVQNKRAVQGVKNHVVAPGGQNSPRVSVIVQGCQNNLGALSSGSVILISSDRYK